MTAAKTLCPQSRVARSRTVSVKFGRIATFLVIGVVSALTGPPAPMAQQASKGLRIGLLSTSQSTVFLSVFQQALGELGYVEGKNLVLEQ